MPHTLLIEQKLEHCGVFNTLVRANFIIGLEFGCLHTGVLHPVNLLLLLLNQLREIIAQFIEIVVLFADFFKRLLHIHFQMSYWLIKLVLHIFLSL